jgi:BCD family chlorophyll transporter-like MFS transporter
MADVLLEPYGGQALDLAVAQTTRLTAVLAAGGLIGFALAARTLGRGGDPLTMARIGALTGLPGFAAIIASPALGGVPVFVAGTLATGLGAGLFGHATLTASLRAAPEDRTGLALGAWGAVQATAAGIGIALAGIVRDILVGAGGGTGDIAPHLPYNAVFGLEMLFLVLALGALAMMPRRRGRADAQAARGDTRRATQDATQTDRKTLEVA